MTRVCPRCGGRFEAAAAFCPKDGTPLSAQADTDAYVGQVLLGQFQVIAKVGAGGMGTVYRARQIGVDRDVAIKILHPELVQNQDAVRRFQREAKVSAALDHPNVVRVFLFGQLPDGNLYIVMEYLEGTSLSDVLRKSGPMTVPRALHITTQICAAIGEAHAHGVVHRDVKPENVILVSRAKDPDYVKVLDFGIARFLWGEQTMVTQTGLIFGTARYISPEGAAGETTDARSDVYSLGVLCYQLLTGETPFDSPSPVALLMKHMHEPAPDIRSRQHGAHVPTAVADVIARALAKSPDARWDDAAVLGEALREAAQVAGVTVGRRSSVPMMEVHAHRHDPTPMRVSTHGPPVRSPAIQSETLAAAPSPFGEQSVAGLSSMSIAGLPSTRRKKRGGIGVVLLSFALGATAVGAGAIIARVISVHEREVSVEARRAATFERAEAALSAEAYVSPPGENVFELTAVVLSHDPRNERALHLRAEAARRLVAEGDQARTDGLEDEARAAYTDALRLVASFPGAQQGLVALEADDRVPLAIQPFTATAGQPARVVAELADGLQLDHPPEVRVLRAGRVVRTVPMTEDPQSHDWVASLTLTPAGAYTLQVHARSGASTLVAEQQITVAGAAPAVAGNGRRPPRDDGNGGQTQVIPVQHDTVIEPIPPPGGGTDSIDWTAPPPPGGGAGTVVQDPPPPPWNGSAI